MSLIKKNWAVVQHDWILQPLWARGEETQNTPLEPTEAGNGTGSSLCCHNLTPEIAYLHLGILDTHRGTPQILNMLLPNVTGANSYSELQSISINAMTSELPTGVSDMLLQRLHFMHHHIRFFHITHEPVLSLPNCLLLDSLTDVL